jgi:DNA gyrase subunit A
MQTKEEDIVEHLFVASTHAYVLVFTDRGRLYWLKVHQIPEVASNARGKAIVNLLPVESNESVRALLTTRDFSEGKYVVMATRAGKIKKTELSAFSNVRATGIIAIDIAEGDDLYAVRLSDGNSDIFVGKAGGRVIRFNEDEVRPMGRGASGVRAVMLREDDHVVEMDVLPAGAIVEDDSEPEGDEADEVPADSGGVYVFTVTEKGYGKRSPVSKYPTKHRGGNGVIDIKTGERNGKVAGMAVVSDEDQILLITEQGMILRMPVSSIPIKGRNILGVRIVRVEENDRVVAAIKLVEKEEPNGEGGEEAASEDEPVH